MIEENQQMAVTTANQEPSSAPNAPVKYNRVFLKTNHAEKLKIAHDPIKTLSKGEAIMIFREEGLETFAQDFGGCILTRYTLSAKKIELSGGQYYFYNNNKKEIEGGVEKSESIIVAVKTTEMSMCLRHINPGDTWTLEWNELEHNKITMTCVNKQLGRRRWDLNTIQPDEIETSFSLFERQIYSASVTLSSYRFHSMIRDIAATGSLLIEAACDGHRLVLSAQGLLIGFRCEMTDMESVVKKKPIINQGRDPKEPCDDKILTNKTSQGSKYDGKRKYHRKSNKQLDEDGISNDLIQPTTKKQKKISQPDSETTTSRTNPSLSVSTVAKSPTNVRLLCEIGTTKETTGALLTPFVNNVSSAKNAALDNASTCSSDMTSRRQKHTSNECRAGIKRDCTTQHSTLFVVRDRSENAWPVISYYVISFLQQITKARQFSDKITLHFKRLIDDKGQPLDHPLLVTYDCEEFGSLEFLIGPHRSEEEDADHAADSTTGQQSRHMPPLLLSEEIEEIEEKENQKGHMSRSESSDKRHPTYRRNTKEVKEESNSLGYTSGTEGGLCSIDQEDVEDNDSGRDNSDEDVECDNPDSEFMEVDEIAEGKPTQSQPSTTITDKSNKQSLLKISF